MNDSSPIKLSPQLRWNRNNPKARRAHHLVRAALRNGTLKRGKCIICGSFRVDAHHPNYDEPLSVIWCCRKHHQQIHAQQRGGRDE